jgi:MFS transporter, MHS family, shikimate and dehydroshikimate transport protein
VDDLATELAIETTPQVAEARNRVLISSVIGSVIEWYDYALYGTAAALIFSHAFFPSFSQAAGTVATFGTFAAGFIARPIGGFVAGYYGDRIGRKSTLVLTLMTMGLATTIIGLLPTYATIGIWAPILLIIMRLVQGFAVGGEWAGAVLMAVEYAPPGRRGLYGSYPQTGVSAGIVLGTGAFAAMSSFMAEDAFLTWGWRIPFLISIILAVVGLYIRFTIGESPIFEKVHESHTEAKSPLAEVLRAHPREVLLTIGARLADAGNYYIFTVFILAYAVDYGGMARRDVLLCVMAGALANVIAIPLWGALSDRVGRRPVFMFGAVFMALTTYPFFLVASANSPVMLAITLAVVLGIGHGAVYGPLAAFYAELFPVRIRYSGMSIGYQVASVVLGGLTPLVASSLILWSSGAVWPVVALIMITCLGAAYTMKVSPETYQRSLLDDELSPRAGTELSPGSAKSVPGRTA